MLSLLSPQVIFICLIQIRRSGARNIGVWQPARRCYSGNHAVRDLYSLENSHSLQISMIIHYTGPSLSIHSSSHCLPNFCQKFTTRFPVFTKSGENLSIHALRAHYVA